MKSSELITTQAAVDGNHRPGDVARERRGEKADQVRDVRGLAVLAHRDVLFALALAKLGRVVAQDLLADDAPGRHAVHRDAVLSDLARQPLRPGMHRRLRGKRTVQALGLGFAGDVDDAAPLAHGLLPQMIASWRWRVKFRVRASSHCASLDSSVKRRLPPALFTRISTEPRPSSAAPAIFSCAP